MEHSREALVDVDLDAPLPTLDEMRNFTTKRGNSWCSMPDESGEILITGIKTPRSATLLHTGEVMELEFRDSSLRMVVPPTLRTGLPDRVRIEF